MSLSRSGTSTSSIFTLPFLSEDSCHSCLTSVTRSSGSSSWMALRTPVFSEVFNSNARTNTLSPASHRLTLADVCSSVLQNTIGGMPRAGKKIEPLSSVSSSTRATKIGFHGVLTKTSDTGSPLRLTAGSVTLPTAEILKSRWMSAGSKCQPASLLPVSKP